MRKGFILIVVFLSLFLVTSVVYCQEPTNWEWKIYFAAAEKWHAMFYQDPSGWGAKQEDFDRIYREIASTYSISTDEVRDIVFDVLERGHVSSPEEEILILDELDRRLDALPDWATAEDQKRVHREIASKYGITLTQLHALEFAEELFRRLWGF